MGKKTKRSQEASEHDKGSEYAVVCSMDDEDQANEYQALLEAEDIPAVIQLSDNGQIFAVCVPEDYLDEAQSTIESQLAYNSFSDYGFDDEEEDDFDDTVFDEDF